MGYYTTFEPHNITEAQLDIFEEISGYPKNYIMGWKEIKWYSFPEDFKKLSLLYPDEVLRYDGVGEDEGDMWRRYAKNGRVQYCKAIINYDKYDESKLLD